MQNIRMDLEKKIFQPYDDDATIYFCSAFIRT